MWQTMQGSDRKEVAGAGAPGGAPRPQARRYVLLSHPLVTRPAGSLMPSQLEFTTSATPAPVNHQEGLPPISYAHETRPGRVVN